MNREQIIQIAEQCGIPEFENNESQAENIIRFAALVAAASVKIEREAIAKIFDEPMHLVPFAQNHFGGCIVCGFTPKIAADYIRARGQQ